MLHTVELYPFQKEGVRRVNELGGRAIIGDEVGLGKTVQSLYYGWRYLPDDLKGPLVAVVPAHLKINWAREAETHLGQHIEILSGREVPPDKQPPVNRNQIYAVNYDILVPNGWNPRYPLPDNSWAGWLKALKPRYVIADEGHMLKGHDTKRYRAFRKMTRDVPHVVILTGTPLTNSPMDLWPLLNIVRPDLYPSRWEFGMAHTCAVRKPWGWVFPGARDLDLLHKELKETCLIRRRKADVAKDLPPIIRDVVALEVDLREYRAAENDFLNWLARKDSAAALRAAGAEALTRMNYLRLLAGTLKVPVVIDWVRDFLESSESKLLIGVTHKEKVSYPIVGAFGDSAVLINGDLSGPEKVKRTDAFNADPKIRLLVGNMQSAGTGWNCTSTSDAAAGELPWTPAELEQFWGRIYGLNRGLPGVPAHVRILYAVDTIEEDISQMLTRKQGYADAAIDGGTSVDSFDLYRQVMAQMQRRRLGESSIEP